MVAPGERSRQDDWVTSFYDFQEYAAIPRVESLILSPDGQRIVVVVKNLAPDRKRYLTSLWEVDPAGQRESRRLTWSTRGENSPAFLPDGTLLFVSGRPGRGGRHDDPEADGEEIAALWALPAAGGEARQAARRAGGLSRPVTATGSATAVFAANTLPGDAGSDADRRKKRAEAGVTAILHESYPIRAWDHELGPDGPRLFVLGPDAWNGAGGSPQDVTPDAGQALVDQSVAVTPDGSAVLTGWRVTGGLDPRDQVIQVVAIDAATGKRRVVLTRDGINFG